MEKKMNPLIEQYGKNVTFSYVEGFDINDFVEYIDYKTYKIVHVDFFYNPERK
jgi:hypothetical protein